MTHDKAVRLLAACRGRDLTIATAESCTGGLIAAEITAVPGASDVFERGFVTYSNLAKVEMLGVDPATLEEFGAVSEPVAAQMASGALAKSGAGLCLAVTGVAGPGGTFAKPEGMVCFGLALGPKLITETVQFGAIGRAAVRDATVQHAIDMALSLIDGNL